MPSPVDRQIAELQALDTPALRERWSRAFKRPTPKYMSRDLLLRSLAYHVQEQAEGGLSKAARRRLAMLADPKSDAKPSRPKAARPRPGTRLVREWRGEAHQVTVAEEGFEYRGERYASLSEIARRITGTRWSGPRFFGLGKANGR